MRECAEIADGGRYDFLTRACVLRVAIAAHAVASDRTVSLGVRRTAQQRPLAGADRACEGRRRRACVGGAIRWSDPHRMGQWAAQYGNPTARTRCGRAGAWRSKNTIPLVRKNHAHYTEIHGFLQTACASRRSAHESRTSNASRHCGCCVLARPGRRRRLCVVRCTVEVVLPTLKAPPRATRPAAPHSRSCASSCAARHKRRAR